MTKTALDLTPQKWKSYQPRPQNPQQQDIERWQQGWELARPLANQLRDKFGVKQVAILGSLLHLNGSHLKLHLNPNV